MTAVFKRNFIKETFLTFPLFLLTHPFKGFDEMKFGKRGSMTFALTVTFLSTLVAIFQQGNTGFVFTGFHIEASTVNVLWTTVFTILPILLICIGNWSVTSITGGSGKFKEIFMVYSYALYPGLFLRVAATIFSNYITVNELAFVTFLLVFAQILLYFFLFVGLLVIHEFTLLKGIVMVFLTLLAIMIISFVLALFFALFDELWTFVATLIFEIEPHLN